MSMIKQEIRTPILVTINLSPQSETNSSYSNIQMSSYLQSPQSISAAPTPIDIQSNSYSKQSRSAFRMLYSPNKTPVAQADSLYNSCALSEEALQRLVDAQSLQNLTLREKLEQEKQKTHMVVSENLKIKQQLELAQKKLKEAQQGSSVKKSQHFSQYAAPQSKSSSYSVLSNLKDRISNKQLSKPNPPFKKQLSFSSTHQKKEGIDNNRGNTSNQMSQNHYKLRSMPSQEITLSPENEFNFCNSQNLRQQEISQSIAKEQEEMFNLSQQSILDILLDLNSSDEAIQSIEPVSFIYQMQPQQCASSQPISLQNRRISKISPPSIKNSDLPKAMRKMIR